MNAAEYSKLAIRTLNPGNEFLHALYGMAGESGEIVDYIKKVKFLGREIDGNKVVDECGDYLWYVNVMASHQGIDFETLIEVSVKDHQIVQGELSDVPELALFTRTGAMSYEFLCDGEIDLIEYRLTCCVVVVVELLKKYAQADIGLAFERNIAKLETRYPNLRFDVEHSNNRDREAEEKAMLAIGGDK